MERGTFSAAAIAPETDVEACAFVDSIFGAGPEWPSALVEYRLGSTFQATWKAEVGHWLLFAKRTGYLSRLQHDLLQRAKKVASERLGRGGGKPDPNDEGHKVLMQVLAPAQVSYYLGQTGWSLVEWEPSSKKGADVDLRMLTPSKRVADIQVKSSDQPGRVQGHRIVDGESDDHVTLGLAKAIRQVAPAPGPVKVVVAVPQRTGPMSREPSAIVTQMLGETFGHEDGGVTLPESRRGLFASEAGSKVQAAMVLDLVRSFGDRYYGCTVLLNPWSARGGDVGPSDFPAAAVCELQGDRFLWHGDPGECHVLPSHTQYEDGV